MKAAILFDPWTASKEEAQAITEVQLASETQPLPRDRADLRWQIAQAIAQDREKIIGGSGVTTLQSMALCCRFRLPVPSWLADAFCACYERVEAKEKSWDAVFGMPQPKGVRLEHKQRDEEIRHDLFRYVLQQWERPDRPPRDAGFWGEIGERFELSKARAEAVFKETAELLGVDLAVLKAKIPKPIKRRRP